MLRTALLLTSLGISALAFFLVVRPGPSQGRSERLPPAAAALVALHAAPPEPQAGDWRRGPGRHERGQSFRRWAASQPTTARGERRVLYVVRVGAVSETQGVILAETRAFLATYFGLVVKALPPIEIRDDWPEGSTRPRGRARLQLNSRWLLDTVLPPQLPADGAALLALTAHDLWPGDDWNFVFGQASLSKRVGVWSLARFGDASADAEARRLCLLRTLKVATHETGHMFSFEHCRAYACGMAGSNTLAETDRAPLWMCPECVAKLWQATGAEPRPRFLGLAARCRALGLEREATFYAASAAALEGTR